MSDAVRRAADAATPPPSTAVKVTGLTATVTAVAAAAAVDGNAQITVEDNGGNAFDAHYLDSYLLPAVNDVVMVLLFDHSPLIVGRVIGEPTIP